MIRRSDDRARQQAVLTQRRRQREALNRLRVLTDALEEHEHFHECPICHQTVDRRRLGDVLHHAQPDHRPIPRSEGAIRRFL